jgi:hypothetical protein
LYAQVLVVQDRNTVPAVLVGNKSDLLSAAGARQVPVEECLALSSRWGVSFLETSAKAGLNVSEAFEGEAPSSPLLVGC